MLTCASFSACLDISALLVLIRAKISRKCTQFLSQDLMTTLVALSLKEKEEIETKFAKTLETIQFLSIKHARRDFTRQLSLPRCLGDTQGSVASSRILHQEFVLTLFYTNKLKNGSLDLNGYVKSTRAV